MHRMDIRNWQACINWTLGNGKHAVDIRNWRACINWTLGIGKHAPTGHWELANMQWTLGTGEHASTGHLELASMQWTLGTGKHAPSGHQELASCTNWTLGASTHAHFIGELLIDSSHLIIDIYFVSALLVSRASLAPSFFCTKWTTCVDIRARRARADLFEPSFDLFAQRQRWNNNSGHTTPILKKDYIYSCQIWMTLS